MNKDILGLDMFEFESVMDIETLSDSFLEELEQIKDVLEEISDYERDEEEDEESEYREVYGGTKEEIKEYQKKFREYVESIKEGLEKIYESSKNNRERAEPEAKTKSPWERGHKFACGCPGCAAYRESHGIRMDKNRNNQNLQTKTDLRLADKKSKNNKYSDETDSRPCGGKHYHLFHGEEAGMKTVLGNYTNSFNFARMGY
ncbi:MAG: hypothetical protein JSV39_02265 [Candidatus Aenigmatarchaeota archaeon]|nr:MAG: hypothetical protein JSV39_02265 [Candidatus Aenigmarchaeota archaeon]